MRPLIVFHYSYFNACSYEAVPIAAMASREMLLKYEAKLEKWKQSKLEQFDSDDVFRTARLKKHSDRKVYEQHLSTLIRKKIMKEKMAAGMVDGKFGHHNDAKDAREKKVPCNILILFRDKIKILILSNCVVDSLGLLSRSS